MASPEESVPKHDGAPPREPEARAAVDQQVIPEPGSGEPIWARIRRHKVVERTLAYVAFGYALLHGVQMLREAFEWPYLVSRLTVFGLVLGAPIAVTLAWYHGYRARHRVSGQELSILIALLVVAGSVLWWVSRHSHERVVAPAPTAATNGAGAPTVPFNPPPHSVAVLPFVNLSGDASQEYFSDGLTEELLNSLSRINDLQVAARTSSFSFQGTHPDIATVAHKLNVASVLEGSVRRSGRTIRVTAQLNNAVTGFHLWSQTFDRDLGDVLKLQTDIATAVAESLKVTLLGDVAAKIELGGTRNPLAFDAYLRGLRLMRVATNEREAGPALDEYAEAIRLDPNFALAYAARSLALLETIYQWGSVTTHRQNAEKARIDANQAIALAPGLGLAHAALARYLLAGALDYPHASEESERAFTLAPGDAIVLTEYSQQAAYMGRSNAAIDIARRGVALDPLNLLSHRALGDALYFARRYNEAIVAYQDAIAVDPGPPESYARSGLAYYALGSNQMARSSCEMKPDYWESRLCLALTFARLGQDRESDAQIKWLKEFYGGDQLAYQYAQIYVQRGDSDRALQWRRDGSATARRRVSSSQDRSALGSAAQGAALPGD